MVVHGKDVFLKLTVILLATIVTSLLAAEFYIKACSAHDIGIPVHQYIALEARQVWKETPDEIKQHMHADLNATLDDLCNVSYDVGDDVITGSAEEDLVAALIEWPDLIELPDDQKEISELIG